MTRLTAMLCLLSFTLGCATVPGPTLVKPEVPPWQGVADNCEVDRPAGVITCDRGYFSVEARRCVDHFEAARAWSRSFDACEAQRALDGDAAASRLVDCDTKLKSPWRSPWLWGILGAVAGAAAGVGIVAGVHERVIDYLDEELSLTHQAPPRDTGRSAGVGIGVGAR